MDKIEAKLDKIDNRITNIDITLAKQHVSLEEHIRRTNMLEEKLIPVEKHVDRVDGALRLIGIVAALATIIEVVHLLFK